MLKEIVMESIVVEIRSAEGGRDSELLVKDQLKLYVKWAERRNL